MPLAGIEQAFTGTGSVASSYQYYLHSDHLNTPRHATDQSQKLLWSWNSDAFGVGTPNADEDGDGIKLDMPLRFPGQQYDANSGLNYNYFRDYDPGTGRYVQSDPIGLSGGINIYAYAAGNPNNYLDPFGLIVTVNSRSVRGTMGLGSHTSVNVTTVDGRSTTYGSYNVNGLNTVVRNDPSDHGSNRDSFTDSIVVPPPPGMTQNGWDQAVIDSAENLANNVFPLPYEIFPDPPASGNCHVTTNNILNRAGGALPPGFNPQGLNPGL
jgi:RHS repeat-associated protein